MAGTNKFNVNRTKFNPVFYFLLIGFLVIWSFPVSKYTKKSDAVYSKPMNNSDELDRKTSPCISSGNHTDIQNALIEVGSKAVLCPDAVFELSETIYFTADSQAIFTEGFPIDSSRALLKIVHKDIATAVSMNNMAHVKLSHIEIDGNRPELGIATGGLIESGGNGPGTAVEWVKAYEPRGWSVLVIGHGDDLICNGAIARNNELGPAGHSEYIIADGISLACRNSIVENNTIVDATDGGIVVFQAPGSLIANNTIRTENRIMFYGISMEDYGPWNGDFTGTRVTGNIIDAAGSMIRRGISMGPYVGCIPQQEATLRSRGAVINNNILTGNKMAYGYVVSGVEDWTVTGNVDLTTPLSTHKEADCFGYLVDPPGGFQLNPETSDGIFQDEFETAVLGFTTDMWTFQPVVSEDCVSGLIGTELLEEIKAGSRGPLWLALESSPNGELIGQCITQYQPPDISDLAGDVIISVTLLQSFSIEVELINISETDTVNLSRAEFILESFPITCNGLPELLHPGETVKCTINDFVTPGFQVLNWYGIPTESSGWGFEYPFATTDLYPEDFKSADNTTFQIFQNYPNPFNNSTSINFSVSQESGVRLSLKIYDVLGRLIRTLIEEERLSGSYEIRWDGKDQNGKEMSSGIYFYRLESEELTISRKMIVMR